MDFKFDKPKVEYEKQRVIDQETPSIKAISGEARPIQELKDAQVNVTKVHDKAGVLAKAIELAYAKTSIPVEANNTDVIAAVQRFVAGSDGRSIPFSLWASLNRDAYTRAAKFPILEISSKLTGDTYTDAKLFIDTDKDSPYWPYLAQMSVILVANQLLGAYSGFDQAAKDSTKIPNGSELGPLLVQLAISFGAYQAVMGLENFLNAKDGHTEFQTVLSSGASKYTADLEKQIQEEAKKLNSSFSNSLGQIDADRRIVLDYASNYVATTTHPGYEAWVRYPFILNLEQRANNGITSINTWLDGRGVKEIATEVPADLLRGIVCENEAANEALDRAAMALNSQYTRDAICCFFKIMSELGEKVGDKDLGFLKTFRKFLVFYVMFNAVFGLKQILSDMIKNWHGVLRQIFARDASIMIRKFVYHFAEPVLQFLRREELDLLRFCTPLDEMTDIILESLEQSIKYLQDALLKFNAEMQTNHDMSWELDMRLPGVERARHLIRLIDALLSAVQAGLVCNSDQPSQNVTADSMDQLLTKTSSFNKLSLPTNTGDPYIDFNDVKWKTTSVEVPFANGFEVTSEDGKKMRIIRDCMMKFPPEIIPDAPELKRI